MLHVELILLHGRLHKQCVGEVTLGRKILTQGLDANFGPGCKQWHFGMSAHTGDDSDSGLIPTFTGNLANAQDISISGFAARRKEC
jgi:hypothetical protein